MVNRNILKYASKIKKTSVCKKPMIIALNVTSFKVYLFVDGGDDHGVDHDGIGVRNPFRF